jgi:adenylate kinase
MGMIRERITRPDAENGFVLDGFPRNMEQAEALDTLLNQLGRPIDVVLQINVDFDLLMQRMVGRLTCVSCGALFNSFTNPPVIDDRCDHCGGPLHHRSDDNENTIDRRLKIYDTQTHPLASKYQQQNKLHIIDGQGEITEINKRIKSALRGIRSKRINLKTASITQAANKEQQKITNKKPEVIRTQAGEKKPRPSSRKKRAMKSLPVTTRTADNKAILITEGSMDDKLKILQEQLKAAKQELKAATMEEKKLLKKAKAKETLLKKMKKKKSAKKKRSA